MPRTASPYLQRLANILNRKLANVLRGEPDKPRALKKAAEIFRLHFGLIADYSQRKTMPHATPLTPREKEDFITAQTARALKDFEKILNDRVKPVQTT